MELNMIELYRVAICVSLIACPRIRTVSSLSIRKSNYRIAENPETLNDLSGLVLTGGTDLSSALYGQARLPETDQPDVERDERDKTAAGCTST
jgi:hypothetical protein